MLFRSGEQKTYIEGTLSTVSPLQSFLVKLKSGGTKSATFTPDMTVKRSAASGVLTRGTDSEWPQLTLIAQTAESVSTAIVIEQGAADNEFVDSEDAETLFDSNLGKLPTIYTVAGQQAVSINVMQSLSTLPLGMRSDTISDVSVTIQGVESFASPLYLYDAELEESTLLTSGYTVVMPSTTAGRFFIVNQKPLANDAEQLLQVYTNEKEVYVTASADMMIEQIIVYDANGQAI